MGASGVNPCGKAAWYSLLRCQAFELWAIFRAWQMDLRELLENGKVVPVVDRCYTLSEVPEALQYYGGGQTRGKVIIVVEQNLKT